MSTEEKWKLSNKRLYLNVQSKIIQSKLETLQMSIKS